MPLGRKLRRMVEPRGIEPLTFAMPLQRFERFVAVLRHSATEKLAFSRPIEMIAIRVRYACRGQPARYVQYRIRVAIGEAYRGRRQYP